MISTQKSCPSVSIPQRETVGQYPESRTTRGTNSGTVNAKALALKALQAQKVGQPVGQPVGQVSQAQGHEQKQRGTISGLELAEQAKSQGIEHAEIVEPGSAEEQKANEKANKPPRNPSPRVAAHELADLKQDGRIGLTWQDDGPAWEIPLPHEQLDRAWIGGLVAEAMLEPGYFKQRLERVRP